MNECTKLLKRPAVPLNFTLRYFLHLVGTKRIVIPTFGFIIDNRKCIGCHACTVACKGEHEVPVGVNRTWVKYVEKGVYPDNTRTFSVMRCNHCEDAPCVDICPVTALYTRDDGIVDFDNERCIGCKGCTQACPYDACHIDPNTNTAAKCNYCTHRVEIGLEPACVNVCPEHAIISGDMDNPNSEIAQLLKTETVTVRKAEKGTKPKLFYINGDNNALVPTAAAKDDEYFWSSQGTGVGHNMAKLVEEAASELGGSVPAEPITAAKSTYNKPDEGIMWGWEVPAYLVTKGIAAGAMLVPLILQLLGLPLPEMLLPACAITALVFLGITGGLLIKDLDRPDRFLYVLLRPQWKSWLVKGAYIITGYGALLSLYLVAWWMEWWKITSLVGYVLIPLSLMAGIYTAFLFGQAKGRDYWQSPMLFIHMLLHTVLLGVISTLGLFLLVEAMWPPKHFMVTTTDPLGFIVDVLMITVALQLLLSLLEVVMKHGTGDAQRASDIIHKGRYKSLFWLGFIVIGNTIPIALLLLGMNEIVALVGAILALVGVGISNHLLVRAPQLIPLS